MLRTLLIVFVSLSLSTLTAQSLSEELSPQSQNHWLPQLQSLHPIYPNTSFSGSINNQEMYKSLPKSLAFADFSATLEKEDPSGYRLRPLIDLSAGTDLFNEDNSYVAGGGISTKVWIKDVFSVDASYMLYKTRPFQHIETYVQNNRVFPGASIVENDYFQDFRLNILWNPSSYFDFALGYDEHFIGRGYRSLMLSDAGYSHPYFKINTSVWHLNYTAMWINMKDVSNRALNRWTAFENKFAAIHYLSWQITSRFRAGFFEAIVWQGNNEQGARGFEINYLNPIIFFRPVEFAIGSPDNAMMGMDMDYRVDNQLFYFQLMLDEFKFEEIKAMEGWWANKQAFQIGWRSFNFLHIDNLHALVEYDYIRPFMYSHRTPLQSYGHYNQPLAHPLGANVMEAMFHLTYDMDRWFFSFKNNYSFYGTNPAGENYGGNIFLDYDTRSKEYNNFVGQGIENQLSNHVAEAAYLVNKDSGINCFLRLAYRHHYTEINTGNGLFVQVGITNNWGAAAQSWVDY